MKYQIENGYFYEKNSMIAIGHHTPLQSQPEDFKCFTYMISVGVNDVNR